MKWVKFRKIELKNYRQFVDEKIEFSNNKKPFNIILGRNGFGKSNIFNAITWCFYGTEKHLKKGETEEMLPLINKTIAKNLKEGEIGEVKVISWLDSDEGEIKIERSVNFRGVEEGLPYMEEEGTFNVMLTYNKNWVHSMSPKTVINRILPEVIIDFFFLDGEKLRQQFEDIDKEQVKSSILDVSQITLLENSMEHLGNIDSEIRLGIKGKLPETEDIESEIKFYEDNLKEIPLKIKEKEIQKRGAEKNKKKLEEELRGSSSKYIKEIQLERDQLSENKKKDEEELEKLNEEFTHYLIEASHIIYGADAIKKTLDVMKKLTKEGRLPPKIENTFLQELLKKKKCICGANISSGKGRANLLKLLKETGLSEVADDAKELKYALKAMIIGLKNFENKINDYSDKIDNLEKNIKQYLDKLLDIRTELKKNKKGYENIEEKEKAIEEFETVIETLISEITNLKRDEEDWKEKLKEKKKEQLEALEKVGKYTETTKELEFLSECNTLLSEIKEKLLSEIRKEIELNVQKDFFDNLITEKKLKEIIIDEDYKISVITEEGYNTLKSLSAGETLCLALSFMAALRNISGFAAPIIIDTPLAKIDEEYRENVLKFLVNSLKNTQINLLVTSSEYTDKVKRIIKPYVNEEYFIKFDKDTSISQVVKK